jgi:hypothetical protein
MPGLLYAFGYVLTFTDGGEPEEQVLHVGTLAECRRCMRRIPAIAYSGDRPGAEAHGMVVAVPPDHPLATRAALAPPSVQPASKPPNATEAPAAEAPAKSAAGDALDDL